MSPKKRMIEVNTTAPVTPTTVQDLIDNLAQFPLDWPISFAPFTLYRTKDRGDVVHFEMNEAQALIINYSDEP